jgi:hypothetical protein
VKVALYASVSTLSAPDVSLIMIIFSEEVSTSA